MTKPTVTDAMLDAAEQAYDTIAAIEHDAWCYTAPTRAAITAAIKVSGLVERIAELEARIDHATNAANGFMDKNKNTAKYFLHISDILNPHVEDTTND
jgi:hypothetical protein